MSKIYLSSFVKESLKNKNYTVFITEFSDFVNGYDSYYFGRNAKNNNSEYIYHVHYVPDENDPKIKDWDFKYKHNRNSYSRTSDNLIFYTHNSNHEYLVILFVSPGGHSIFSDRLAIDKIEKIGFNFVLNGTVP